MPALSEAGRRDAETMKGKERSEEGVRKEGKWRERKDMEENRKTEEIKVDQD